MDANGDALRREMLARLPGRYLHILGAEKEADTLAQRYGADRILARQAALLHDVTKKYTIIQQLQTCAKYGIVIRPVDEKIPKILHAITGAEVASREFGACAEVAAAIRAHTTGCPDMTTLQKVVYLADMIEPSRAFSGVDKLRGAAYRDLDAALLLCFDFVIELCLRRGQAVHPDTVAARNDILWMRGGAP